MPEFIHKPVLVTEVLKGLSPKPGGRYVDATVGGGGHAAAILAASSPTGWLYGCDRDGVAIEAAARHLTEAGYAGRFELRRQNFIELAEWIPPASCDAVLMDLGVSSPQLDDATRGFSFQRDGPLDMRMDSRQAETAAEMVNCWSEAELGRIFREYGDEPHARSIAKAIVRERQGRRVDTTGQLAGLIERLIPRRGKRRHPATRVFQALRMAVNDETRSVTSGLAAACTLLGQGGRLVVITFHSTEDRLVKAFGREQTREYTFDGEIDVPALRRPISPSMRWVQRKSVKPTDTELAENPRARSAQLRVLEKV